jgi:hypothetical protein
MAAKRKAAKKPAKKRAPKKSKALAELRSPSTLMSKAIIKARRSRASDIEPSLALLTHRVGSLESKLVPERLAGFDERLSVVEDNQGMVQDILNANFDRLKMPENLK